jgi:parvulin-like peptidyl-prolyl isomerase
LEDGMAGAPQEQPRKLTRQQMRAQAREKRDAAGWIATLGTEDPWMRGAIRGAIGNRHVTRTELEEAIGMSLEVGAPAPMPAAPSRREEPERITLQHILISFAGSGTRATRSKEEAEKIAGETLARANSGEEFGDLVKTVTDDSFPGIYRLCNTGVAPQGSDEYRRGGMVAAFGDVGFALDVGEIGMSTFDPKSSPYGWHIIKRLA